MDRGISSTTRQLMEQQIKANLAIVYPNALPNVLATEVRMVESKAFATAMSCGNYLVNVSTYIETHKERINGAQYVQRIPKFTRQEENARRAKVRESLSAGEEKMAQHASKHFRRTANVGAKPPYVPQTAPSSPGMRSSAPPLPNQARLSRQSAAVTSAHLGQPSSTIAACSDRPFAMRNMPQERRFTEQKILEVTEALEKERLKAMNTHREKVLKNGRDTALCAHRAVVRRTLASQRPQTQANQARDINGLKTNQVHVMQSLQSHAEKPQSIQPQARQILAQPAQNTRTFQMQQVQGLNSLRQQALQSKALQTRETKAGLQTQHTQEPSQIQQHSQMLQHESQLHAAERHHSNKQSKSQAQIQGKAFAFPHGPNYPQVIAAPDANPLSQTRPPRFTDDLDQLQTIEPTRNVPQINNSLENLIRPPFQTLSGNQALPEMNSTTPHHDDPQAQLLVRNQPLPVTSSVPQVQPLQSQPPPEMLTDEALQRLSPNQLRSLLKQAYDPSHRGFQAPPEVQNVNFETLLNQKSNNAILQLSAVRQQTGGSSGHLSQQQALKQASILQAPAFHLPMASPADKRNENIPSTGQQNQGVPLRNDRNREQELPLQIARNQVRTLQPDQNTGQVSSAQETLAAQMNLPPASAPQQQLISNTASQNLSYQKQYSESVIPDLARAAVRLEDPRGRSKNSSTVTPTQRRGTSQAAGQQEASKHVNPGLTSKSNELMHTMPAQNSGSPLPMSREKQVLLANWVTFQRDYRTRFDRIIPILETLFAPNPTENEKRTLRNIQTIRSMLHQRTTRLAESRSANSNYHKFMALTRNVFRKYSKYEHMTRAQLVREARSRNPFAEEGSSQQYPVNVPQSTQKSTLNRASGSVISAPTVDIRGQAHSGRESLKATTEQINDVRFLAQQNQVPGNARRQEHHQRQLPARQLVSRPDPKRVQAIVQQHIKTSVEKKIRDYIALAVSSHANPEHTEMTGENMNGRMEPTNGQANMTVRAIDNPIPVTSSLVDGKHVPEGNKAKAKTPSTSNLLTKTFIPVTSVQAKMANVSTDNQREQLRYPDDGNFRTQRADVQGIDAPAQQNTDDPANRGNQEATFENSGKVEKNGETSQALDNLAKEIGQSVCHFQKAVDEDPILNGSVWINEKDTRTDEEALSNLQDLLDGKRSRKRSARVEETLIDMEEYRKESEDAKIKELEPAAKKRKNLTLREQVELDCFRVHNLNDSVKCLIQEEHDKLLVLCSIDMREHKVPILKISILEGYPSLGKVQYNLETPSSGWLPPFDVMRSRFTEVMRSETEDCCMSLVVGKWLTVVQSVLITE